MIKIGKKEVILNNKQLLLHRVIAETFIPNVENKQCVNHKDGNKLNNHVSNLEWCSYSENTIHSFKNNLQINITNRYGKFKVLTKEQVDNILDLYKKGMADKDIAERIMCSRELVGRKIREAGLR